MSEEMQNNEKPEEKPVKKLQKKTQSQKELIKQPSIVSHKVDTNSYFWDCEFTDEPINSTDADIEPGLTLFRNADGKLAAWTAMQENSPLFIVSKKYQAGDTHVRVIYAGKVKKEFIRFAAGDWQSTANGKTVLDAFLTGSRILPV